MANQTALKLHTNPGEQVICDKFAHIYNYEAGGASFNSGISCKLIDGNRGMFTAQQVKDAINPDAFYYSKTTLVEIENTANRGGGSCWNLEEIKKIRQICDDHKLGYHLDGARIWNALVAKNETAKQYGNLFDTISVCLSKGLGCPIGSVLLGDEDIMADAVRIRKVFGGNMRQVGYLAAAGLYALDNNINRLKEDHKRAKEIGAVMKNLSFIKSVEPVETNIIIFELLGDVNEAHFINELQQNDIKLIGMGSGKLRLVTHLDYTEEMHEKFLGILQKLNL
jgi:threonine aldolase